MSSTNLTQNISTAAASEVIEKWAEVGDDSIPYLAAGDSGRDLLLVHGAGSSRKTWEGVMPALSGDNRLFAPDLMGFGDAPRYDLVHTPEYLSEHLVGFMDAVGVERAALVGHSLGGAVCLEVAIRHPERVSALVLEAPMGFGKLSWRGRSFSITRWWIHKLLRLLWLHKLLRLRSPYPRLPPFPNEGMDSSRFESLSCETLLLWGTRDAYFPLEQSRVARVLIPALGWRFTPRWATRCIARIRRGSARISGSFWRSGSEQQGLSFSPRLRSLVRPELVEGSLSKGRPFMVRPELVEGPPRT